MRRKRTSSIEIRSSSGRRGRCRSQSSRNFRSRYPDDEIEVTYADENIGENAGYVYFLGGEGSVTRFDSCSQEAYEAYVDCWDEDERLYQD